MLPLRTLLTVASAFAVSLSLSAADWPAWRGPTADGVTAETNLPLKWSATENVKWKVELPEPGNSTPIVQGDRIFLTQAVGTRRTLMCLDRKDGRTLWQQGTAWDAPERTHKTNPYCPSSPVTDGERVIAWFGSAGLFAYDFAGKELWRVDLGKQDHEWGYGASPVIEGDLCILNFGPGARSFVVAVNKRTGREAWRFDVPPPVVQEGPGANNAGYMGSWHTPVLLNTGARRELVVALPGAVFGLDPSTGRELWHCNGLNPLAYANPLLVGETLVGFGGYSGYAIGVKTGGSGDVTATHRLWQEKKNPQRIGSGVVVDGSVVMGSDQGVIQCIDAKTGVELWNERPQIPGGRTSSWSSIVRSGGRLYLVTKNSDTLVFKAGPKFELLATNPLGDGMTNASIAVSNGELFIRTHKHLWCIAEKK